jgi:hypothetical protein
MMKLLAGLCVLFLFSVGMANVVTAQRHSKGTAPAANKSRTFCQGDAIPKGYVIAGLRASEACGAKLELEIKKPADRETVCDGSPVPSDYSVVEISSHPVCSGASSNPLTNAMVIAKDGSTAVQSNSVTRSEQSQETSDEDDDEPRKHRALQNQKNVTAILQERAEEVNQQAEESLERRAWSKKIEEAIKNHQLLIGMTQEQVLRSWGRPSDVNTSTTAKGTHTRWWYNQGRKLVLLGFDADGILEYVGN